MAEPAVRHADDQDHPTASAGPGRGRSRGLDEGAGRAGPRSAFLGRARGCILQRPKATTSRLTRRLQLAGVEPREEIPLCGGGLGPAAEAQAVRRRRNSIP